MANVQQLLEQQESFQLWCQHPLASLTHCLQLLDDLEYNPAARPVGNIPKDIMHSATQKDSFGSIKFPSSAGTLNIWYRCCDAIDLYIIELIINSNYREYATKSSNMSSALHRWSATNHHQEPEELPMWEQPRRTTPWCGNVVFFHNFDPASDSDWALKQRVARKSSWL